MSRVVLVVLVVLLCQGVTRCEPAETSAPPYRVTASVVSHPTTREISVWVPDAPGQRPVVTLFHGLNGSRADMEVLGRRLAAQGYVVFAPDWTTGGDATRELECSYRYVLQVAADHGGDPRHRVLVGYSAGATYALLAATNEAAYGPAGTFQGCFTGAPRPDVLVLIAPCLFAYGGQSFTTRPAGGNHDLAITVVSGEDDPICAAWQQRDGVEMLRDEGYAARLVSVPGANHFTLVYHDSVDGQPVTLPESAAGQATTTAVLDAIDAAGW